MKRFSIFTLPVVMAMLISACTAPVTPTINQAAVESTSVAAAFTIIAQTQTALPTSTLIPLTETLMPTETQTPSPVTESPATATQTSNPGNDPCNVPFKSSVADQFTQIRIINNAKAPVVVTLYLNITPFGECGYRAYSLGKNDETTVTDWPFGCYSVSAFVNDPKTPQMAGGYGCINNVDVWTFDIHPDSVKFYGP